MSENMTILTTNEVAEMLRLHPMTVCKYAANGKIPCIQLGRVYRFSKESIEAWLNEYTSTNEQREGTDETPE